MFIRKTFPQDHVFFYLLQAHEKFILGRKVPLDNERSQFGYENDLDKTKQVIKKYFLWAFNEMFSNQDSENM